MADNLIVVINASKKFKEDIILNDVNITFEKNKIHGVIGRNGSGKTMLFKCICGFVPLTSGEIIVDGKKVGKDVDIPDNIGIIIEAPGFLPNYNAYNNLKMLAMINNKISKKDIKDAIDKVGLDPDSKKHVGKFSLGMRQRLGIAQAVMENPDILILDEPMNGLDNSGVQQMRQVLKMLRDNGKTILLASHSAEDIDVLCDTVHEMDAGVISKVR